MPDSSDRKSPSADEKRRRRNRKLFASALSGAIGLGGTFVEPCQATLFVEGADFSDTFASADVLPVGTTEVQGQLSDFSNDSDDYFLFVDLTPGAKFTFAIKDVLNAQARSSLFASLFDNPAGDPLLDMIGNPISIGADTSPPVIDAPVMGTVPSNGVIVANINASEVGSVDYAVTLDVAAIPEPSAVAMMTGASLLGGYAALRRKLKNGEDDKTADT